jgi:hypothetical protein
MPARGEPSHEKLMVMLKRWRFNRELHFDGEIFLDGFSAPLIRLLNTGEAATISARRMLGAEARLQAALLMRIVVANRPKKRRADCCHIYK